MQKVLITGASGFVGEHLISVLKDNYSLIGLTFNSKQSDTKNITFLPCDINNQTSFEEIISQHLPDIIIHLAAKSVTWDTDLEDLLKVNFFGTLNLYKIVAKLKKSQGYDPKIIYISSATIYGKTHRSEKISESSPLFPIHPYGFSKLCADRLSYQFSQTEKLKVVILRPFNNIGPGQRKGFFVSDMASQIAEIEKSDQNKIMVGNLEPVRDFTDVRDIVQAYKAVTEKDITPGEAYNVCSGEGFKMMDILKMLIDLSQKEIEIVQDPQKMRPTDIPILIGDNSKFKSDFDWEPKLSIEQTLKDTLEYWRNQN